MPDYSNTTPQNTDTSNVSITVVTFGAGYITDGKITTERPLGRDSYRAREFGRAEPLDFEPDVSLGLKLPFKDSTGRLFDVNYVSIDQAVDNLKNLLLTQKGERVYHPRFGTRLRESLFEPNYPTLVAYVEKEIREAISFWLPYIHIANLNVKVPDVGVNNTSFIDRMHGLKVELTFGLVNNKLDTRTIVLEIKAD
tara:strand:+ start:1257 stop:1844 length:588 start_codon:yes stop_codon:yes gene_type:complete